LNSFDCHLLNAAIASDEAAKAKPAF